MKSIRNWEDLRPYGIDMLTGEACAYMNRALCDVTDAGVKLLAKVFGADPNNLPAALARDWNGGQANCSAMLPYDLFKTLAFFALFEVDKCAELIVTYDGVHGLESTDSYEAWERWCQTLERSSKPRFVFVRFQLRLLEGKLLSEPRIVGELFTGYKHEAEAIANQLQEREREASAEPGYISVVAAQTSPGHEYRRFKNPGSSRNTHAMSGRTE